MSLETAPEAPLAPSSDPSTPSTPAPAIMGAPAAPSATPTGTSQPPATGGTPSPGTDWVPSYRLREAREAAQRQAQTEYASKEAAIRQEADRYRQQVLALTGVTPPPNPEVDAVKQQFYTLFPRLKQLEEAGDELLAIRERAGDLEAQNQHYWSSYAQSTMDKVYAKTADALGVPLNEDAKRQLHSSFVGFVQSSPELNARYSSDPTIVEDFVKAFTSNFIDPVRRGASAAVTGRAAFGAALPQDTPSGAPRATPAPQLANLDERTNAAWAQYQQTRKG